MKGVSTEVVILGGSLVGLSASLFLSARGVKNIVIERHLGSSPHPRAMGYTEHTLEFFRGVGLGDRIPQADPSVRLRRVKTESLATQWEDDFPWTPGKTPTPPLTFSPVYGAAIAQDKIEPILRTRAIELGSNLMLGFQLVKFEDKLDGITITVKERSTAEETLIKAKYMIAADGGDSPIRETLGISRSGVGNINTIRSVLFSCPEADQYLDKGVQQFEIEQPDFKAFLTTYHDGRWVLMFSDDQERSKEELGVAILKALGKPMAFEIITTGRWDLKGLFAETYSKGRVFLAGDAAHQLPPTRGGFGANTGIDDAYNLAWKLEFVLRGYSNEKLLETYSVERQPIGVLRHDQTFARPDYARIRGVALEGVTLYNDAAMELGQLLRSSSIVGADDSLPPAATPAEWAGQPGVRAPHMWVTQTGQKISTIDLFTKSFVLISEDSAWIAHAKVASQKTGVPLSVVVVGKDIEALTEEFEKLFGITKSGASLIRPDGVVSWRATAGTSESSELLLKAITQSACAKELK